MLWDIIYDFFIQYVFGGVDSGLGYWSSFWGYDEENDAVLGADTLSIKLFDKNIFVGNYLSLIATIITMVVIVLICCHFIKKVYNIFAHVIA